MNQQDFISAIKTVGCESVVSAILDELCDQREKRGNSGIASIRTWYQGMEPQQRQLLVELVRDTAEQATYNLLLVLDGLLTIEPPGEKGALELYFVKGRERVLLNPSDGEQLTSLFKSEDS